MMRSSYGLCGIVYEVTLRIKPIEALHFTYLPRPVNELTQAEVDNFLDTSEGLICWTVGRTAIFQQRYRVAEPGILSSLLADARRLLWNYEAAHVGQLIDRFIDDPGLRDAAQRGDFDAAKLLYADLHLAGGITLLAPDKTIDYHNTPASAKYAFTFWAFPRSQWLTTLRAYLDFTDQYFKDTGFRCNMPLGAYHIRRDASSLLSYTQDQEIFSIDPIHAPTDVPAWQSFLQSVQRFRVPTEWNPVAESEPVCYAGASADVLWAALVPVFRGGESGRPNRQNVESVLRCPLIILGPLGDVTQAYQFTCANIWTICGK